jgi:hypothetical protein
MAKSKTPKPKTPPNQAKTSKRKRAKLAAKAAQVQTPAASELQLTPEAASATAVTPESALASAPQTPPTESATPQPAQPEPDSPAIRPASEPTTSAKTQRAPKQAKPTKLSALDAAARVLAEAGQAMTTSAMIQAMAAKGYWTSPGGQTPAATLYTVLTMLPKVR